MKSRILLDSNVVIQCVNGRADMSEWLSQAETVYLSPVVIAECLAGLRDTAKDKLRRGYLERLFRMPVCSHPPITSETAKHYVQVWQLLADMGRPIPTNDIWIAAQTLELNATLVTSDSHFTAVPLLDVSYFE